MVRLVREKWEVVVGYEGLYEVSNLGRLRSLDRIVTGNGGSRYTRKGRMLRLCPVREGYVLVTLRLPDGKGITERVHRLVALAFKKNYKNLPYVNHKNGIKHDNRVANLEWCTAKYNSIHARSTGLIHTKLTKPQVLKIVELLDAHELLNLQIARIFGVDEVTITNIHLGDTWNYLTNRKGNIKPQSGLKGIRNPKSKPVLNCRGEEFINSGFAADKYKAQRSHIISVCNGLRKTAGKYSDGTRIKWYYKSDSNTEFIIMDNAIDGHPGE